MEDERPMKKEIQYISGTFLMKADAAFINGAGTQQQGETQTLTIPKVMWKNGQRVPYVSSQAWKHFLRETLIEETKWPASRLRAIGWNPKGNTNKIGGMLNPVDYPEDDIFGYMYAYSNPPRWVSDETEQAKLKWEKEEITERLKIIQTLPTEQLVRPSTFLASLLYAIQSKQTISQDDAYVHLGDGTPLPYSTQFYNADLQAIFGIDWNRIGVFDNSGGTREVDPNIIENAIKKGTIEKLSGQSDIYARKDIGSYRGEKVLALLRAIVNLSGGAKMTQFGVDIAPKAILFAGISCKTPFLNNMFKPTQDGPVLNISLLKELIGDYKGRIVTPIYIGMRGSYLQNEQAVTELKDSQIEGIDVKVASPFEIVKMFGEALSQK